MKNYFLYLIFLIVLSSIAHGLMWQETTSLIPSNRVMHSSLTYRSPVTGKTFLYVINGDSNSGNGGDSLVYIGEIQPDGNILSWSNGNTFALADTSDQAALIYENGNDAYIYVIAGSGCTNRIQYAMIINHDTGELSDWSSGYYNLDNSIGGGCNQNDVRDLTVALDGDIVYIIGGRTPAGYESRVRWNQINSTGGFSNQWTTTTPITLDGITNIELSKHTLEVIEVNSVKYIYLLGGENNNGVRNSVYRKKTDDLRSPCINVGDPGCWIQGNNLPINMRNHASFNSILSYGAPCIGTYGYVSHGNKIYASCFDNVNPTWSDVTLNNALPNGASRYKHSSASLYNINYIIGGAETDVANQDGTKNVYFTMPNITGLQINAIPNSILINGQATIEVKACVNNNPFPNCLTNGNAAPDGTLVYFSVDNPAIGNVNILSNITTNGITTVTFLANNQVGNTNVHAISGSNDVNTLVNVVDPSQCTLTEAFILHPIDNNFIYRDGELLHYGIQNIRFKVKAIGSCNNMNVHFLINEVNNRTGNSTGEVLDQPLLNNVPVDIVLGAGNEQYVSSNWTTENHAPVDLNELNEDGNYDLEYMFVAEIVGISGSGLNSSNWIQVDNINGATCQNGVVEINEECDCGPGGDCLIPPGDDLNGKSCTYLGYLGGNLDCIKYGYPNQCMFNVSSCSGRCGNNLVEQNIGEICDPPGSYCASPPYFRCSSTCDACLAIQPGLLTILTKTACMDDGNGDDVGSYEETVIQLNTNNNNQPVGLPVVTPKECTLTREVYVPFFSYLNVIIVLVLLLVYYSFKKNND